MCGVFQRSNNKFRRYFDFAAQLFQVKSTGEVLPSNNEYLHSRFCCLRTDLAVACRVLSGAFGLCKLKAVMDSLGNFTDGC